MHSASSTPLVVCYITEKSFRLCTNSDYLAHTDPMFNEHRLLKICDINYYQIAVFMYKFIHNNLPDRFCDMFIRNNKINNYSTRSHDDFHVTNPKTIVACKSIRHCGPDIWNSLSVDVKNCSSLFSFKSTLKKKLYTSYTCVPV